MTTATLLATATLGLGCSLALNLDDEQPCEQDSDCVYSDGQGRCVNNVCRPPDGNGGTDGTTTDDETGTTAGPTTAPTDPSTSTTGDTDPTGSETSGVDCSVNTDCSTDERCADSECVSLLSAECQILEYPNDVDRDTVEFVGSIYPTGGAFTNLVEPLQNATLLAFEDFNAETTLQGDRQVAWVGCDSTAGADAAEAAARHLVDTVGVPAIVGPIFSESALRVAEEVTIDAGVFLITPTASATSITDLNDDDLVWRTIAPDSYQSNALIDRVPDLAPDRILLLAKDDAYGNGILASVLTDIENEVGASMTYSATYPNPADFATQEEMLSAYATVLAGALGSLPSTYVNPEDHFTHVLIIGTSEAQSLLYAYLGQWALMLDGPPDPPMPIFTFSHGAVPDMEKMIEDIGVIPGTEALEPLKGAILANMQGTSPNVFDQDNFDDFNIRYRIRFMGQDALTSSALSYDATLATFFAMCTVPEGDAIDGAKIAAAFPKLRDADGTAISFSGSNLNFISDARNTLVVSDGSVDLQGVSGDLNWDDEGDIRTDVLGWDMVDIGSGEVEPRITPARIYILNDAPATDGTWVEPIPG